MKKNNAMTTQRSNKNRGRKKMTPQQKLLSAVRRNKPYEAAKAIKEGADVNKHGEFEETPLHVAASFASYKAMRVLLKHGADVDADQRHNKTPLRYAVDRLYYEKDDASFLMKIKTIRELLAAGANEEAFDLELYTPKSEACVFAYMQSYERFKEHMMKVCPQDLVAEVIGLFTADKDLDGEQESY